MPLFQKKESLTDEEKRLRVVAFWLFVVAVFSWAVPFAVLFVLGLMGQVAGAGSAFSVAFVPSLITFLVSAVLCVIVFFAYKKLILKL